MRRAGLKIAQTETADRDDRGAMSAALDRLYGAAAHSVADIVSHLTGTERARLAVFCYGRAHLNSIGLAIAATCELDHLMAASNSGTAARAIFTQSRERALVPEKPLVGRRGAISLAPAVSLPHAESEAEPHLSCA